MRRRRWLYIAALLLTSGFACDIISPGEPSDRSGLDSDAAPQDGSSSEAPSVHVAPETLSFSGTETAELAVEASGAWSAEPSEGWISVAPAEGAGDQTLTVTIDRAGLEVDTYAGSIHLVGESGSVSVPVMMRFPEVHGTVSDSDGSLTSLAAESGDGDGDAPSVPGELIVRLDPAMVALEAYGRFDVPVGASELKRAAARLGAHVGAHRSVLLSPAAGLALLEVDVGAVGDTVAMVEADGRSLYAEPNRLFHPTATNDPHYDVQWHYQQINLENAWEITTGDADVTVAVIDADFHPDHPDLAANLLPGWNFVDDTDDIFILNEDCLGHGTHVAGTVAAVTDNSEGVAGVGRDVRVLPLNVAIRPDNDDSESGCGLSSSAIARAILYAAGAPDTAAGQRDEPVDVINLSLGGDGKSLAIEEALQVARAAGVVTIAAAGNSGGEVKFPASSSHALAVSATDQFLELTDYSSRGPEVWVAAPGGNLSQELQDYSGNGRPPRAGVLSTGWLYGSLPGVMVYDTATDDSDHGYLLFQGTSMASPHVAGVVALMRSVNSNVQLEHTAQILSETAVDLGAEGRDDLYGYGLVDAAAAVAAAAGKTIVPTESMVVRLLDGGTVVAETSANRDGTFNLGGVAAGQYTLVAGDFEDGEGESSATVYGEMEVSVTYDGDVELDVQVSER